MTTDFKLSLPLAWVELDLNRETRAQTIPAIVAERGGAGQQLGLSPEQLADLLENLPAQTQAQNDVYAAFYSDVMEGTGFGLADPTPRPKDPAHHPSRQRPHPVAACRRPRR